MRPDGAVLVGRIWAGRRGLALPHEPDAMVGIGFRALAATGSIPRKAGVVGSNPTVGLISQAILGSPRSASVFLA